MKLLHLADLHIGSAVPGLPDAVTTALGQAVEFAIEEKVDAVIWAGDTFHSRRPSPSDIRVAIRAANRLRGAGIALYIGTGNHDGYVEIGRPESHVMGWWQEFEEAVGSTVGDRDMGPVHVMTEKGAWWSAPHLNVVHVPYPHKRLLSGLGPEEQVTEASRLVTRDIAELEPRPRPWTNVLTVHASVAGARLGSEAAMKMGWDTMVDPVVFEPWDYVALGHIHVQQQVAENAWYAGSLIAMGWGDELAHGGLLVDLEDGRLTVESIPVEGPEWLTLTVRQLAEVDDWLAATSYRQDLTPLTLVRVIAEQEPEPKEARRVVDALRSGGAAFAKVQFAPPDRPRRQSRERVPDLDVETLIDHWCDHHELGADVAAAARNVVQHVRRQRHG